MFDDFFRHVDDAMRNFMMDDPWMDGSSRFDPHRPFPDYQNQSPRSLRDQFVEPHFPSRGRPRNAVRDGGMSGSLQPYGFDSFFDQIPQGQSYYKSYTYSKTSNGDKIEERKIETDHSGKKIESITRKMGDKVVSVTSRGDVNGVKEVDQNLINIDEEEIDKFDKEWRDQSWFNPWSNRSFPSTTIEAIEDAPREKRDLKESERKEDDSKSKSWLGKLKSLIK
ncbi:uncharacterized protein LOC141848793 [Brevipalpus obovatus]|uniref:uncharacterized protein LOC141848793 n=1 Tax=Brevipalpus obovatus TaxID=246614 RepID=UPI003D9EAA3B